VFGLNAHNNAKLIKEHIGVVFDELGIPDTLNCKMLNNVMKNIYKNWNEDVFYNYIKLFSLPKDKIFKNFSRGMQMKVQTAVALSHNASLLVLDEATSGLDPIARNELLDILLEFMEDENHSILMSSHITSDLERIADYITFIDNGSLLLSDEKYIIQEGHALAKGSKDDIQNIPNDYVISIRNNSYGSEALITQPEVVKKLYPNYVYDKISLDDILCFYANRS
jgi:ABC-2 type transport system ATP-binding protein